MKKTFYYFAFTLFSFYCLGQTPQIKQQTNKPPIELPIGTPPYNPIPDNLFFSVKKISVELPKNVSWDQFVRQAIIEGGCIQQFPPRWKGYNGIAYRQSRKIKDLNGNIREVGCTYPHNLEIWPPDYGNPDEPSQYGHYELARFKNPINVKKAGKTIYVENDILLAGKLDNNNQYNKDGTRNAFQITLLESNKQKVIAETITDKSNTYCFWNNPINIKKYPEGVWIQVVPIVIKDIGEDLPPVVLHQTVGGRCTMPILPTDKTYLTTEPEGEAELCYPLRIGVSKPILNEINSGKDLLISFKKMPEVKLTKKEFDLMLSERRIKIDFDFYNILENENTSYKYDNKSKLTTITTPIKLKEGTVSLTVAGEFTSYKLFDPQNPNKQQRKKDTKEWDWSDGTVFDPFGPVPPQK